MSRKRENSAFICAHCHKAVLPLSNGSYRNHCSRCLYSLHVDEKLGDRASRCGGLMRPVGIVRHSKKGLQIIHQCEKCGVMRVNKIAEHTQMPDDLSLILRLMSETT